MNECVTMRALLLAFSQNGILFLRVSHRPDREVPDEGEVGSRRENSDPLAWPPGA